MDERIEHNPSFLRFAIPGGGEQRAYVERIIPKGEAKPNNLPSDEQRNPEVTGYIYVVRTMSTHPSIAPYKDGIFKIDFTSSSVKKCIAARRTIQLLFCLSRKLLRCSH